MVSKSASGQPDNLIHVSETRTHHLRLISVFLIVVVNPHDRRNAWILVRARSPRHLPLSYANRKCDLRTGEISVTPASAHATACAKLKSSVRLQ